MFLADRKWVSTFFMIFLNKKLDAHISWFPIFNSGNDEICVSCELQIVAISYATRLCLTSNWQCAVKHYRVTINRGCVLLSGKEASDRVGIKDCSGVRCIDFWNLKYVSVSRVEHTIDVLQSVTNGSITFCFRIPRSQFCFFWSNSFFPGQLSTF